MCSHVFRHANGQNLQIFNVSEVAFRKRDGSLNLAGSGERRGREWIDLSGAKQLLTES